MAVYAAHLTRTLQGTPTVFQVTAQEALGATVKPALRKVVEYLAATYPTACGWCLDWYDEVYLLLDSCLQYYYLKHYAASFSESFYELLRVPTSSSNEFNSGQQLPVHLERASLALLVLVPYLRDRLERIVEKWREDDEDGRLGKSRWDKSRRAAWHVHATLHTVCACARLLQLARYAAGRAASHAPALAALGLTLKARRAAPRARGTHLGRPRQECGHWKDWERRGDVPDAGQRGAARGGVRRLRRAVPALVGRTRRACAGITYSGTAHKRRASPSVEEQVSAVSADVEDTYSVASIRLHILLRVHLAPRARSRHVSGNSLPGIRGVAGPTVYRLAVSGPTVYRLAGAGPTVYHGLTVYGLAGAGPNVYHGLTVYGLAGAGPTVYHGLTVYGLAGAGPTVYHGLTVYGLAAAGLTVYRLAAAGLTVYGLAAAGLTISTSRFWPDCILTSRRWADCISTTRRWPDFIWTSHPWSDCIWTSRRWSDCIWTSRRWSDCISTSRFWPDCISTSRFWPDCILTSRRWADCISSSSAG